MSEERYRQKASIEFLLVWAYRHQMVHEARSEGAELGGGGGPLASYSNLWVEGAPVDNSRKLGGDASPDARRVHALVLKLGRVTVDCGQDLAAARYHRMLEYRGAEPPGAMGSADRMARPWPTNGLVKINLGSLVMLHASRNSRPEWPVRADFRLKAQEMVWKPKRRSAPYNKGWFQHVTIAAKHDGGDPVLPGDVERARMVYVQWRDALATLRAQLAAIQLTMWSVTNDLPPPP